MVPTVAFRSIVFNCMEVAKKKMRLVLGWKKMDSSGLGMEQDRSENRMVSWSQRTCLVLTVCVVYLLCAATRLAPFCRQRCVDDLELGFVTT